MQSSIVVAKDRAFVAGGDIMCEMIHEGAATMSWIIFCFGLPSGIWNFDLDLQVSGGLFSVIHFF